MLEFIIYDRSSFKLEYESIASYEIIVEKNDQKDSFAELHV